MPLAVHAYLSMHTAPWQQRLKRCWRMQGAKGRYISSRHQVLHATKHEDAIVAIVCPDPATSQMQSCTTMRVYRLRLDSLVWELVAGAPHDPPPGEQLQAPISRIGAACCQNKEQVCALNTLSER